MAIADLVGVPVQQNVSALDVSVDDVVGVKVAETPGGAQRYIGPNCPSQGLSSCTRGKKEIQTRQVWVG